MDSLRVVTVHPERDKNLFQRILALRFDVYCRERGFENPADFPEQMESDLYDKHSIHLAAVLPETNEVIGTIRIIRHSEHGFPLEKNFRIEEKDERDKKCLGEISRLAIPKKYCQNFSIIEKLYDHLFHESGRLGITHWYAGMAKGLPVLLKRRKIHFQKIGPEIEFHGVRAPYFLCIPEMARESRHFSYYEKARKSKDFEVKKSAVG